MYDYVKMGYWVVLPFSSIKNHPYLKLAPAGVVPQRERRPRPIMDYTFNNINQTSLPIAPFSAMQFGSTLQRLLQRLAYCNPSFGPPLMAKIDLADGYYRIPLAPTAALQLAVILPPDETSAPLVGIPLLLPMGWSHSPPFFCAFTETATDIINNTIHNPVALPTHPILPVTHAKDTQPPLFSSTAQLPWQISYPPTPLQYADIYTVYSR
jgi:hypothetical protein